MYEIDVFPDKRSVFFANTTYRRTRCNFPAEIVVKEAVMGSQTRLLHNIKIT